MNAAPRYGPRGPVRPNPAYPDPAYLGPMGFPWRALGLGTLVCTFLMFAATTSARAACERPALPAPSDPSVSVHDIEGLTAAVRRANREGALTILLQDGTYALSRAISLRADHITVRGASGRRENVVLRGQGMDGKLSHIFQIHGSNITLANLTAGYVRQHAVQVHAEKDADDFHAYNVRFVDAAEQIIKVSHRRGGPQSDRGLIEWCTFEFSSGYAHQAYTGGIGAIGAKDWTVRDSVFRNIRMAPGTPGHPTAIMFRRASEGTRIERNIIMNADSGIRIGLEDGRHASATVVNNRVHVVRDVGISLERAEDVLVAHNTVWSTSYPNAIEYRFPESKRNRIVNNLLRGVVQQRDQGEAVVENNVEYGTRAWFVAPERGELTLAAGHPGVIDRAVPVAGVEIDIDCARRPSGLAPDIGAEEYAGVADLSIPVWAEWWQRIQSMARAAPYRIAYIASDLRRSPKRMALAVGAVAAVITIGLAIAWSRRRSRRAGRGGHPVRTVFIALVSVISIGILGVLGLLVVKNGPAGALGTITHRAGGLAQWVMDTTLAPSSEESISAGGVRILHRASGQVLDADAEVDKLTARLRAEGLAGVKVSLRARSPIPAARLGLNAFDLSAMDNISPRAGLWLGPHWRSYLLQPGRFTYNARRDRRAAPDASISSLTLFPDAISGYAEVADLVVYRGQDTTPPSAPSDLVAKAEPEGIALAWTPSQDNLAVDRYVISRSTEVGEFAKIAESADARYVDPSAPRGTMRYRVAAADPERNLSPWSDTVRVASPGPIADAKPPPPAPWYADTVRAIHRQGHGTVDPDRVLLFGDSLTGARNYAVEIEAALGRYAVTALGRAGSRTAQGVARLAKDLDAHRPALCLILYGTNDDKRTPESIATGVTHLREMVQLAKQRGVIPIVATIPPRGFTDPTSAPEANFNAAVVKMALDEEIPLADIFAAAQKLKDRRQLLARDGVHWAASGFSVPAEVWQRSVARIEFVLLDAP